MSPKNIKVTSVAPIGQIRPIDVTGPLSAHVKLSFKYLDCSNTKYDFKSRGTTYFVSLLERLKHVTNMKSSVLQSPYQQSLRNHSVNWGQDNVTERGFGIPNGKQLDDKAFQFCVTANAHGRVIGALIEHVFYVVWLDVDHQVYAKALGGR